MSRPIVARHLFDFDPILSGWNKISVSAGPSHDVIVLALKQPPEYRDKSGLSAKLFVDKPNNFRIHHLTAWGWNVIDLQETWQNLHYAQPLTQNQWIAVRARSAGNTDGNGHLYSAQGNLLKTIVLGDGIRDVQTTIKGQIWVGYFDEGIFGGTTFGQAGLACFDSGGALAFDFNSSTYLTSGMISDCYAFNTVSDSEIWLCPYTDFPIVQIKNKHISKQWDNNPVHGSDAFAVWKDRVLFAGGYSERGKLFIVSLYRADGQELLREECSAGDENGDEVKFVSAFGRGSRLYLETDRSLYFLELQET